MATDQFTSTEDISKHYDKQIKAAGDDELAVANLRAERAERVAEFTQREAAATAHRARLTELAAKHNIPSDLVPLLDRTDLSSEDLERHAERLSQMVKAPVQSAADVYGGPTAGGGSAVRTSKDREGDWMTDFEQRFNAGEQMSQREYQRYASLKLGRHAYRVLKQTGKQHVWGNQPAPDFERF